MGANDIANMQVDAILNTTNPKPAWAGARTRVCTKKQAISCCMDEIGMLRSCFERSLKLAKRKEAIEKDYENPTIRKVFQNFHNLMSI